jgi:AraC family transcriptional regulator of adaptative response/methylated-DNA-[protein]-cysteine methyltransferase
LCPRRLLAYDGGMKGKRTEAGMYAAMAEAIAFMRSHAGSKLSSADVAGHIGMSPSRFEHAFAEWAGISPRRYLAYLSAQKAKLALGERKSAVIAAERSGLSGAGRLHDLMVTYEAVTPGEFKSGGLKISYGIHPSPFGWCLIGVTDRGVCQLSFMEADDESKAMSIIKKAWPKALSVRDDARTGKVVRRLPLGETASYADIARKIGKPKAVRAVGSACGSNNIGFLIPCHRVLRTGGGLGGFGWGLPRKEAMLGWEEARKAP